MIGMKKNSQRQGYLDKMIQIYRERFTINEKYCSILGRYSWKDRKKAIMEWIKKFYKHKGLQEFFTIIIKTFDKLLSRDRKSKIFETFISLDSFCIDMEDARGLG